MTIKLKWTAKQPTKKGWYFYRYTSNAFPSGSGIGGQRIHLQYVNNLNPGWNTALRFAGPFKIQEVNP